MSSAQDELDKLRIENESLKIELNDLKQLVAQHDDAGYVLIYKKDNDNKISADDFIKELNTLKASLKEMQEKLITKIDGSICNK